MREPDLTRGKDHILVQWECRIDILRIVSYSLDRYFRQVRILETIRQAEYVVARSDEECEECIYVWYSSMPTCQVNIHSTCHHILLPIIQVL